MKLISTASADPSAFLRMAQDWREHDTDRYALALDDFGRYLQQLRCEEAADQPMGRVPSAQYCLECDGEIMACIRLRFYLTPDLEQEGGHIGYDVRPSARGKGFGTTLLRLVLVHAKQQGLERVLLTADAQNLPSLKVIERNGGVLSGEVISPTTGKPMRHYWIALPP